MRLVFFGSGAFGLPTLQALSRTHEIACIVTQPDRPAGRGGKLTATPIGAWASQHLPSTPLLKPEKVNTPEVVSQIRAVGANAWVVIAFGQKLGKSLLDGMFAINLHASLLPRWRGAAPINAAMLAGDEHTGNSVITLADRMDAGLILGQSHRPIDPRMTAGELHDALASDGPALVERVLQEHAAKSLRPAVQDESKVTLAAKLSKGDGAVNFARPAISIRQQIHALTPWPSVAVRLRAPDQGGADLEFKLLRVAEAVSSHPASPGALIDPAQGLVACGPGTALRLLEVQPAGKRAMGWSDFARGRQLAAGITLNSVHQGGNA